MSASMLNWIQFDIKQAGADGEINIKKGLCLLCGNNGVDFNFIEKQQSRFPVRVLCRVMEINISSYCEWCHPSGSSVDSQLWKIWHRLKVLFSECLQSPEDRRLMKLLGKGGFQIGLYRIRRVMKPPDLVIKRKEWFILTTDSKHQLPVAENLLSRDFSQSTKNQVWTTNIKHIWALQRAGVPGNSDWSLFTPNCWLASRPSDGNIFGKPCADDGCQFAYATKRSPAPFSLRQLVCQSYLTSAIETVWSGVLNEPQVKFLGQCTDWTFI